MRSGVRHLNTRLYMNKMHLPETIAPGVLVPVAYNAVDAAAEAVASTSELASSLVSEHIDPRVRAALCSVYHAAQVAGNPRAVYVVALSRALKDRVGELAAPPAAAPSAALLTMAQLAVLQEVITRLGPSNGIGACVQVFATLAAEAVLPGQSEQGAA